MMLDWLFARRYLFSRKSHSVINIISGVSAVAVSVPVAAMVILLSVFNGLEGLVKGMYNDFDPDVMVVPARGKVFESSGELDSRLTSAEWVAARSYIVEENVMVEYRGGQSLATVRGVDSLYGQVIPIEGMIHNGEYALYFGDVAQAVVGQGLAWSLGVNTAMYDYMTLYAPRRGQISSFLPIASYRRERLLPAATFALEAETDGKYIIAPIETVRSLLDYPDKATGIAVKLKAGVSPEKGRESVAEALGPDFRVLTRYEQKASLYRIMRYEKWGIFLIIGLVLIIASFSVIGTLVMLIIEKREDLHTIVTMGGTVKFLRSVFTREGMLVSLGGAVAGMVIGVGVCLLQQHFGLITIPADTFLVSSYPVIVRVVDLGVVALSFSVVSWLIVRLTVIKMIPKSMIRL